MNERLEQRQRKYKRLLIAISTLTRNNIAEPVNEDRKNVVIFHAGEIEFQVLRDMQSLALVSTGLKLEGVDLNDFVGTKLGNDQVTSHYFFAPETANLSEHFTTFKRDLDRYTDRQFYSRTATS